MNHQTISIGNFTFFQTSLKDLKMIETKIHVDDRGNNIESYNQDMFQKGGIEVEFVQENQSLSKKGVLRGLHFQRNHPQGKLVRVLLGEVYDVAVDLRKDSPTYGKWEGVLLSEENRRMLYIPEGFAHGFLALTDVTLFAYKCTDYRFPEDEDGIIYNDPSIGIQWPTEKVENIILSDRDKKLQSFLAYEQASR